MSFQRMDFQGMGFQHRSRNLVRRSVSVSIFALTILTSTAVAAEDLFGGLKQSNGWDRIKESYEDLAKDPVTARLLRKKSLHSLMVEQRVGSGSNLETTKFQHYYKGLEVMGSMSLHHRSGKGASIRNRLAQFDLDIQPRLTVEAAVSIARAFSGDRELKNLPELRILPSHSGNSARLIYWVELKGIHWDGGQDVLVDAHSGKVIADLPKDIELAPIQISSARKQGLEVFPKIAKDPKNGKLYLEACALKNMADDSLEEFSVTKCMAVLDGTSPLFTDKNLCQLISGLNGFPMAVNPSACKPVVIDSVLKDTTDPAAKTALENASKVVSYYKNHLNRDSYDDRGSPVVSVIHGGDEMANAFWRVDQNIMVYGDGDDTMGDLTEAVDVAGHEMTHGVTTHSAQLLMMGESGALNEAHSDFFGKLIENENDWVVGRKLFKGANGPKGIRDIQDPTSLTVKVIGEDGNPVKRAYPAHMKDFVKTAGGETEDTCNRANDRCYVHVNSTIPSHAAYLVYQAIGQERAEKLYYTTLTQNLTAMETFKSAAEALQNTCTQLEMGDSVCDKVKEAMAKVGL